jgi:hydrogenase maturation protease
MSTTTNQSSSETRPRILVACLGNVFFGDDGFGVEVARRLADRTLPSDVRVVDFGIRGIDLTFALLDDCYEAVILVDAAPRGAPPGTLYVIEPEGDALPEPEPDPARALGIETHALDPARVLRTVAALGGRPRRMFLVGCEPTPIDPDGDPLMDLSAPVRAAAGEAVALVETLVAQIQTSAGEAYHESP